MPQVLVFPDKFVKGINQLADLAQARRFPPTPLVDALAARWPTDAHFVCYSGLTGVEAPFPRVNAPALDAAHDLVFDVIAVDVDTPNHAPAELPFLGEQLAKIPPMLRDNAGWYMTAHGFRLLWTLPRPLNSGQFKTTLGSLVRFLNDQGVLADTRATDPQRLFRLPRVVRDGTPQDLPMDLSKLGPLRLTAALLAQAEQPIREGERDARLTSEAGRLRAAGLEEPEILEHLRRVNASRVKPPLEDKDLQRIARSVSRYEAGTPDEKPPVLLRPGHLPEVIEAAVGLLASAGDVYQRAGDLVHVVQPPREEPRIVRFTAASLAAKLAELAEWARPTKDGPKSVDVPIRVAQVILDGGAWPGVSPLVHVASTPLLRPSGELVTAKGYDAPTGALLVQGYDGDPPKANRADAIRGLAMLKDLLADFPFASQAHRSAALALLLTVTARAAFAGPAPLFLINASTRASGKGLLADLAAILGTGWAAPKMGQTRSEELEKRVTSVLLAGLPLVVLDNITRPLGGAVLDALITSERWLGRRLGESDVEAMPNRATWIATGNNVMIRGDMARRVVHVYLDPGMERPELRGGWRHKDLLGFARANRQRLVLAALTIPYAFLAQHERPELRPFGSFEGWSALVRGALVWLGEADPLSTQEELHETADEQADAARVMLAELAGIYGDKPFTVRDLIDSAMVHQRADLRDALAALTDTDGIPTARKVAFALHRVKNRVFSGLILAPGSRTKKGQAWKVEKKVAR